jgi:DNA-binding NarL/FixJ family response regulator
MSTKIIQRTASDKPVRIVLIDDHQMFREGLAEVLGREKDFLVCGQAADRRQALAIIGSTQPDLALVDLTLPDASGIELIKDLQVRHPKLAMVVVSMHEESLFAERAIAAGARGYLTKQQASSQLVQAIRRVLAGEIVASERITQLALARLGGRVVAGTAVRELSDREAQVLELIGQGHNNHQIARRLHLDLSTVETYRARIKEKLRLKDATELLQYAIQWSHGRLL